MYQEIGNIIDLNDHKSKVNTVSVSKILSEDNGNNMQSFIDNDFSILHLAVKRGEVDVVNALIDSGVNIDLPSRKGTTALAYAVKQNQEDIVDLLLQRGANPYSARGISLSSLRPLELAAKYGNNKIIQLLLKRGVKQARFPFYGIERKLAAKYGNWSSYIILQYPVAPEDNINVWNQLCMLVNANEELLNNFYANQAKDLRKSIAYIRRKSKASMDYFLQIKQIIENELRSEAVAC